MDGLQIIGCKPRPDVVARIAADRERIEQRARRDTPPVETRAARAPCTTCGLRSWFNDAGTRCLYCGAGQTRTGSPTRVEHRSRAATPPTPRVRRCGHCGGGNPPNCCATMWMAAT